MIKTIDPHFVNPVDKITYVQNWNGKLRCKFHTTIRLDKEYFRVGNFYQIWCKVRDDLEFIKNGKSVMVDRYLFNGLIHEKKTLLLDQLPSITAAQDTGYTLPETKAMLIKMYPDVDFTTRKLAILLIENIDWIL